MKHIIIVPIGIIDACNQAAWSLNIQENGQEVLLVRIIPDVEDNDFPVTHLGGMGKLGSTDEEIEERRLALEGGFESGSFPGAMWWRLDDSGILQASYLGEDESKLDFEFGFEDALESVGLKIKDSED